MCAEVRGPKTLSVRSAALLSALSLFAIASVPADAADMPGMAAGAYADPATLVASYPAGGQGLVNAVANAIAANPQSAASFCSVAGNSSFGVQSAVGAGMANGVRYLRASNDVASAGMVHSVACGAPGCQGAAVASYAASMGDAASSLCQIPLNARTGPPPSLFRITPTGGGGGAQFLVSPN